MKKLLATAAALAAFAIPSVAQATPLVSPDKMGINTSTFCVIRQSGCVSWNVFGLANQNGIGQDRAFVDYGHFAANNAYYDTLVSNLAQQHIRLYAAMYLGLQESNNYVTDAQRMVAFAVGWEARYGPGGTFWSANPNLPNLPTVDYEIGNEENTSGSSCFLCFPATQYAYIYHQVAAKIVSLCASCTPVVGGLLDTGDLTGVENYISAISPPDYAIGYHPYLYDEVLTEQHLSSLESWLAGHDRAGMPLHVNEFDATNGGKYTLAQWGSVVQHLTSYAFCTFGNIGFFAPYWWGDTSFADTNIWFSMVSSTGVLNAYGNDYFSVTKQLAAGTGGC